MFPSNICGQETHIISDAFLFINFPITSSWLGLRAMHKWSLILHLALSGSDSLIITHLTPVPFIWWVLPSNDSKWNKICLSKLDPDCNFLRLVIYSKHSPRIGFHLQFYKGVVPLSTCYTNDDLDTQILSAHWKDKDQVNSGVSSLSHTHSIYMLCRLLLKENLAPSIIQRLSI